MYFLDGSALYVSMNAKKHTIMRVDASLTGTAIVTNVLSPDEIEKATMRRLRAEIIERFGTVKNFAPLLSSIGYEGLNANLAGRSDMKLSTLYECLALIEMDQVEFARRVMTDAERAR